MSYQVLARKWRPRNFAELVGQEHVRQALTNALDSDRLHHAFLFTGTRGVGKTTIARILAKSLNCEQGISSTPCGTCPTCTEINEGRYVDLIEVDAASRTKVDETRELLENVQYAPTRGRYKVYLIDEVHMFSNSSFNALLKTLEEPPPHVKFLLATTDPQKLPVTILSRCLQFNLKHLSPEQIRNHLEMVLGKEGVEFDIPALGLIARAADGSMRDALSLLDQAIAFGAGTLRESDVRSMLGSIEQHHVIDLLTGLADADASALLTRVAQLAEQAPDFAGVLAELISTLHRIALVQAVPGTINDEMADREAVLALAGRLSPEDVQLYYQIALIGRRDLPLAPTPRGGFEMVLLRMLAFRPDNARGDRPAQSTAMQQPAPATATAPVNHGVPPQSNPTSQANLSRTTDTSRRASALADVRSQLTGKTKTAKTEKSANASTAPGQPIATRATPQAIRQNPPPQTQAPPLVTDDVPPMPDYMKEEIPPAYGNTPAGAAVSTIAPIVERHVILAVAEPSPVTSPPVTPIEATPGPDEWESLATTLDLKGVNQQLALNCALTSRQGNHFTLSLSPAHAQLLSTPRENLLREALSQQLGATITLSINVEQTDSTSPAMRQKQRQATRQRQAEASIEQDHTVQALRETFAAQVNPGSVQPVD
ncbi:MAG: DNA polymerase III subunit gamma/tau [Gammaproteobacteria bacterium]|nr:DNA polymerase III subunit gamma/tau [Gammaproteobacteria bacterium]MCF6362348.1 DNA polymerase III subunit gamma/tau [Gammaproteobacteria bacterium]